MPLGVNDIREIAPLIPEGLPLGLRNYWYPVLQSEELPTDRAVGFTVLGEALAAWRDAAGKPCVVRDRCPHRSVKLSAGRVLAGELQCILHGLRFDGTGKCTLIPWENEQTREGQRPAVQAYPAAELGGYVWAYLGDANAMPPPPLEKEVPEELTKPDEFIWFRMPTEVWKANWLLTVDGSDGFHAVVLHSDSQAVANKTWTKGAVERPDVPLVDRRVRIVKTSHGIRGVATDKAGNALHHGHFTKDVRGDRFTLPCLTTNPIVPAPGATPYTARLWQFPIDAERTQIVRYAAWRAKTAAERENATRVFNELTHPRFKQVSAEDAAIAEAQGDLVTARSQEYLLTPDVDVVKVRRLVRDAYVSQQTEAKRIAVRDGAMDYPF